MFPERLSVAIDPESTLEGGLAVLRGSDGGAAAVVVRLRNRSRDYDVVLKVDADVSAFIMLTATDHRGAVLSRPARRFDSSEARHISMVRIPRGSSHRWRVPIAAQLPESAIPEQGVRGRLVVNPALLYAKATGAEDPPDAAFKTSVVTLYDMDVHFTRAALREGGEAATVDPHER